MVIMVTVGMVAAVVQMAVYAVHNKRAREGKHASNDDKSPQIYVI